jgi:DnaK suppressor protein
MKINKETATREKKLQQIRKKLLLQKEELLSGAGQTRNTMPDETVFPELGDQASAEIDRNFVLRLRDRERKLLKKIEDAIEKIDTGTYGICESCGQPIGLSRLEARPVTTMCIDCKTEQEEEEKLREK